MSPRNRQTDSAKVACERLIAGLPLDTALQQVVDALFKQATTEGDTQAAKFLLVNLQPDQWKLQPTALNRPRAGGHGDQPPQFGLTLRGA